MRSRVVVMSPGQGGADAATGGKPRAKGPDVASPTQDRRAWVDEPAMWERPRPLDGDGVTACWRAAWLVYLVVGGGLAVLVTAGALPASLYAAVGASSALAMAAGGRHWAGEQWRRWAGLAAGVGAWAVADLLWQLMDAPPFPSAADALYLAGYALVVGSLVGIARSCASSKGSTTDAVIVMIGGAGLVYAKVIGVAVDGGGAPLARLVAVAYPLFSLGFVGVAARLVLGGGQRRAWKELLAVGMVCQLIADAVYATQSVNDTYVGGLVDLGWLSAYVLMGAAALHPSLGRVATAAPGEMLSRRRLVTIALACCAPLGGHVLFGLSIEAALVFIAVLATLAVLRVSGPVEAFRRATTTDELTGLPNRVAAFAHVECALAQGSPIALLHCDIDRLKLVNEALGHDVGDALIVEVARRARRALPAASLVARCAGDELLVLADAPTVVDALVVASTIQAAVGAPVELHGVVLHPTVSIGVALGGLGEAPASLVRRADIALESAKGGGGRGAVAVHDGDVDEPLDRLRVAARLRAALDSGGITVALQPEHDLGDGSLFGFEVLARWQDSELGHVPPDVFIPLVEEMGLADALFASVLDAGLRMQRQWQEDTGLRVPIAVNVSPTQLGPELVEHVAVSLQRWSSRPGDVWLELTESTVTDDDLGALSALTAIRALGVHLAIDDFGTGHSSLARLAAIPWDAIKIDRSFVDAMLRDRQSHVVVESVIALGRALGIVTIAEGVERSDELEALRVLGCTVAQGYLLSRPLSERDATFLVRRHALAAV